MSSDKQAPPAGLRVFTCGHSFHAFVAEIVAELARNAGIVDHCLSGLSAIGRSPAIWHWEVPDEQNLAKAALRAGEVDVLTLSCMSGPDEGIGHFARLAAAHNPACRVTLQELWLPEDRFPFDAANRVRTSVEQFNGSTMADLQPPHEAYFQAMEAYVAGLNGELGRPVVHIVPDAQATLALRARIIAGTAPGIERQSDLFLDPWGHPAPPLKVLTGYCHFAVIYRCNPLGLPAPALLTDNPQWGEPLNRLLQQCAWEAVTAHPMSGVAAK